MKLRTRPLTLLSGSLLALGLVACTGEPPAVGYGPGKAEVEANAQEKAVAAAAAAAAADKTHKGAHSGAKHHGAQAACKPGEPGCRPGQPGAQPAAPLPEQPSPDIKYDAPFDGTPVATSVIDGVTVEDFVVGVGPEAAKGAAVVIHYTGYLTDGTVFDTSLKRGRPFPFDLGAGRVIAGWDKGVVGMRAGGKRRLVIPAALGYKARAAGKIPPNSTLIFTLEMVSMSPPLPPPQPLTAYAGEPLSTDKRPNGLIVSDYRIGTGAEAAAGLELKVHYQGTLEDRTEFDSSHGRAKPISFVLGRGRVIKGWDQGITGMKVGGLRKLVIPADLAYGERARGKIPSNAQLTFLVELMEAKPAPAVPVRPKAKRHGQPHGQPRGQKPGHAHGEPASTAKPTTAGAAKGASGDGGQTGTRPAKAQAL